MKFKFQGVWLIGIRMSICMIICKTVSCAAYSPRIMVGIDAAVCTNSEWTVWRDRDTIDGGGIATCIATTNVVNCINQTVYFRSHVCCGLGKHVSYSKPIQDGQHYVFAIHRTSCLEKESHKENRYCQYTYAVDTLPLNLPWKTWTNGPVTCVIRIADDDMLMMQSQNWNFRFSS